MTTGVPPEREAPPDDPQWGDEDYYDSVGYQAWSAAVDVPDEYVHGPDQEPTPVFIEGAEWGAGWAFAIIGMAQAIRDADAARKADAWANTGEHAAAISRAFDPDDPVGGGDDVVVRGPPTARR